MTHIESYHYLIEKLMPHLSPDEMDQVKRAYTLAETAHEGQRRDEGAPYIVHPLRVAIALVDELQIHSPSLVCSALLHDVIEDSPTTREEIARGFGEEIARIVWLLTKFEDVSLGDYLDAIEGAAETGAPIVKLCDRLDNLRSLANSPKVEKKYRYIRTTEYFYLPLASRTNAYLYNEISRLLEDVRAQVQQLNGG
jgi:GTP pyrophosphokinase